MGEIPKKTKTRTTVLTVGTVTALFEEITTIENEVIVKKINE
jgi:hypothetical protein